MRLIDADVLKQHIDKLPALPDGNFAGNHSALKALINMQPTFEPSTNCSEFPNNSDTISRQAAIDALKAQADTMRTWVERYAEQRRGILTAVNIVEDIKPADVVPAEMLKAEIYKLKCQQDSDNQDYYTGYMSALSTVEGILAEMGKE